MGDQISVDKATFETLEDLLSRILLLSNRAVFAVSCLKQAEEQAVAARNNNAASPPFAKEWSHLEWPI